MDNRVRQRPERSNETRTESSGIDDERLNGRCVHRMAQGFCEDSRCPHAKGYVERLRDDEIFEDDGLRGPWGLFRIGALNTLRLLRDREDAYDYVRPLLKELQHARTELDNLGTGIGGKIPPVAVSAEGTTFARLDALAETLAHWLETTDDLIASLEELYGPRKGRGRQPERIEREAALGLLRQGGLTDAEIAQAELEPLEGYPPDAPPDQQKLVHFVNGMAAAERAQQRGWKPVLKS